jgi:hypothetical protein
MASAESTVTSLNWRKALRSATNGECVEVASRSGQVVVRDSKSPNGPILSYTAIGWCRFIEQAKKPDYSLGGLEP